jgi:putative Mg2+ transporter-C (MgtC) family protein
VRSQDNKLTWPDYDWQTAALNLEKMGFAYVLTLPIGWDREREERGVGIRTFPIVAMASCAVLLIPGDDTAARSRVLQGLLTGIGFVGAGAIVKNGTAVHGTATAASIWNTAAAGAAVAMGRYEIAIALAVMNLLTLKLLLPLKRKLDVKPE